MAQYDLGGQSRTDEMKGQQGTQSEDWEARTNDCAQPNTLIGFLYRDAENNKVYSTAIVSGAITDTQIDIILSCLDEGEWFIPAMVGLEGERFSTFDPDIDHPWFELSRDSFEITTRPCTTEMDVDTLVTAFEQAAAQDWQ